MFFLADWAYAGNVAGVEDLRNQLKSIQTMVGEVEATLQALSTHRPLAASQPSRQLELGGGPPPLPFQNSAAVREYLSTPRNAAVLASYIMERITDYTAANFPREFASLVLAPQYKKSVFWTPIAPK